MEEEEPLKEIIFERLSAGQNKAKFIKKNDTAYIRFTGKF